MVPLSQLRVSAAIPSLRSWQLCVEVINDRAKPRSIVKCQVDIPARRPPPPGLPTPPSPPRAAASPKSSPPQQAPPSPRPIASHHRSHFASRCWCSRVLGGGEVGPGRRTETFPVAPAQTRMNTDIAPAAVVSWSPKPAQAFCRMFLRMIRGLTHGSRHHLGRALIVSLNAFWRDVPSRKGTTSKGISSSELSRELPICLFGLGPSIEVPRGFRSVAGDKARGTNLTQRSRRRTDSAGAASAEVLV